MATCIICGTDVNGHICSSHEEDVVFEFRGDSPDQLVPGRFYRGVVDGYAEFGVFVDLAPGVTGLLHRSELDRRLESLDWEPGDGVFVQVKNVRDNGDIDLTWSIRQREREFRGSLLQDGTDDLLPDDDETTENDDGAEADDAAEAGDAPEADDAAEAGDAPAKPAGAAGDDAVPEGDGGVAAVETRGSAAEAGADDGAAPDEGPATADQEPTEESTADDFGRERGDEYDEPAPSGERERVAVETLGDLVGETVRLEGEVVGARQTGGPTVFELRDETGVVDCAAFVEAGVRAYPQIDVGDVVRLDGEVEIRRDEIQVETTALIALEDDDAAAVQRRLADALAAETRPDSVDPLGDHDAVAAIGDDLEEAAQAIREAVLTGRPVVVRHTATADGYVAGAAIERAVLPLVREEHSSSDAEYHYFDRRPLEETVYGMDPATDDATAMLRAQDRHGEQLPLVVLAGLGATAESADGLGLLGVYDAERLVVDAGPADSDVAETAETVVAPALADGVDVDGLSTGALAASLAAAVNDDVRADLRHLPAVSYWEDTPESYVDLAREAGYGPDTIADLRAAVSLEAFYQSYEDKRELISDLLFAVDGDAEGAVAAADPESLASHVAAQFREKVDTEVETARANLDRHETGGVAFAVLDADAYSHEYDFPPTPLLLDELARQLGEEVDVVLGIAADELWLRTDADLDVRTVAAEAGDLVPEGGLTAHGVREGRIEFLAGARDDVEDAVVAAVADEFHA